MADMIQHIVDECAKYTEKNPIAIFNDIARKGVVRMHGPEHHILDGACILTAFKNAGGNIDLEEGLEWMAMQGNKMPGAACGHWGVCGAVTSVGTALAFIDKTGPLSTDGSWGNHMMLTSKIIEKMGIINGPRCCKRDGYLALTNAIEYINEHYDVKLEYDPEDIKCGFSGINAQCIGNRCPFHQQ